MFSCCGQVQQRRLFAAFPAVAVAAEAAVDGVFAAAVAGAIVVAGLAAAAALNAGAAAVAAHLLDSQNREAAAFGAALPVAGLAVAAAAAPGCVVPALSAETAVSVVGVLLLPVAPKLSTHHWSVPPHCSAAAAAGVAAL